MKQKKQVEHKRGPELGKKMEESFKKGEKFRAENQGRDSFKTPGSSNSEKPHNH
jgi:hypothetical protein